MPKEVETNDDLLIDWLHEAIRVAVRLLAVMMTVVIFLDFKELAPEYIWATAAVVAAMGGTYWLVHRFDLDEDLPPHL